VEVSGAEFVHKDTEYWLIWKHFAADIHVQFFFMNTLACGFMEEL
jgi:hypothetical protein